MLKFIADLVIMYLSAFVISFLTVLSVVKAGRKSVMRFVGADIFTFDVKKRLKLVSTISLVLALLVTLCFCFL